MLAAAEYPSIRPAMWRGWRGPATTPSRCYLPQSWPVYRLQRLVSLAVCVLAVLLLCLVAFVLLQAAPASPRIQLGRDERTAEDEGQLFRMDDSYNSDSALDEYEDEEDDEELVMSEDYEEDEEYEYNPEFDMSYFDFSIKDDGAGGGAGAGAGAGEQAPQEQEATTFRTPVMRASWAQLPLPPLRLVGREGLEVVRDGVMFSPDVEAKLKDPGMSDEDVGRLLWQLRSRKVTELRDPSWERCGRPKNQWVRFSGSVAACARYRYPDDHLLLGEVLSFYLARLLQISRVPPATLARPDHPRWTAAAPQMERAGWGAAPVVVLTPWLPDLVRDYMPASLHHALATNTTLGMATEDTWGTDRGAGERSHHPQLRDVSESELVRLLQWSDLLLFDFLTANYDRVAYMLDAAEGEGRPDVLVGTVHNLVLNRATGGLWLLDNESGLVDGYSVLYGNGDPTQATRFASFHRKLLRSMCLFRRTTIGAVLGLSAHPKPHELLVEFARDNEPLLYLLPDPLRHQPFLSRLSDRLQEVRAWVAECARKAVAAGVSVRKRGN
ncbi:Four-jointed box protein 1 [Portunus trituberculatus]|uniref:Four-jointed box protein 1 n=1 Tax=Portunus trituberculatus TaxID=210409 RepID=A0A5B7GKD0_PORTR|nr:Four-jointed box protein 1 [Portunus trituberculatus]